MEEKQVIEGNRLIADFIGNKRLVCEETGLYTYWGPDGFEHESGAFLKYHTSWDWLMPVVEKISHIPLPGDGSRPAEPHETFYPRTFGMLSPTRRPMVRINATPVFEADTLIEAAWLSVVDFIKWHKTQK